MRDGFHYAVSLAELAVAGAMTKRQVQHLSDNELLPEPDGVRRINRVGVVGAFLSAGHSLLSAGRLAAAIADEANTYDGETPDNLTDVARMIHEDRSRALTGRISDPLFVYSVARTDRKFLIPGEPLRGDVRIEIIGGEDVFWDWSTSALNVLGAVERRDYFAKVRRIARGQDVEIIHAAEQPEKTEDEIKKVLVNAVSVLRINCSLAIRNAYERLLEADPRIVRKAEYS